MEAFSFPAFIYPGKEDIGYLKEMPEVPAVLSCLTDQISRLPGRDRVGTR